VILHVNPFPDIFRDRSRSRIVLFSLLAFGVVIYCIYLFAISVGHPLLGIDFGLKDNRWVVSSVDTNGVASNQGIKLGDRPLVINGQPAEIFLQPYAETGVVYEWLLHDVTLIDANGQIRSVNLDNFFPFGPVMVVQISMFVVCLVFWIVGFAVFFLRPRNRAAILLCFIGLFTGILFCGNISGDVSDTPGMIASIISSAVGPWLLLHFFLVLPEERTWAHRNRWIYLVYLPAAITIVLLPVFGFAGGQPVPPFRIIRFFTIGVGLLAVVVLLLINYLRAASARTRQQMKIVAYSCLLALVPILVLLLLPQLISGQNFIPPGYITLFLIFIPVGMGVAVLTQKLMDIDLVIRRSLVYASISVFMAAILSTALFPVLVFKPKIGTFGEVVIVLVLGGIGTALFGPMKRGIEYLIDKFFYKDRYDYRQIIHSFSSSLSTLKEVNDISRLIVGTSVQTLNLAGGCLFVKSQAGYLDANAAQGTFALIEKQQKLNSLIGQRSKLNEFPDPASDPEVAYMVPLTAGDTELGILFLSHKINRQEYSADDIFLLQGLVSVVSTALHSALLLRDVSLRSTFVSIASHELRTPLTSILGYAELMLLRNPPEESRKKWLGKIISNGQQISSMVDDLLNVSRIQSGKVSMKIEPLKLEMFLQERLNVVRESDSKHSFELRIEPGLPEALVDRDKFGQVVGNLLNNAVKFSPNGGRITLSAAHDSSPGRVAVSVEDEGMGIGPADRDSLFTTFHRIQRPETQGIRGSGLGLYIVKEWTEAMGGEVRLESELNKGSTFSIIIPAADHHQEDTDNI
jgi:signal transduction histidine kinase